MSCKTSWFKEKDKTYSPKDSILLFSQQNLVKDAKYELNQHFKHCIDWKVPNPLSFEPFTLPKDAFEAIVDNLDEAE